MGARAIDSAALRWAGFLVSASVVIIELSRVLWYAADPAPVDVRIPLVCVSIILVVAERLHPRRVDGSGSASLLLHVLLLGVATLTLGGEILPGGLTTAGWALGAFVLFAVGFLVREARYRWIAFGALALTSVRLILFDLTALSPNQRIVTFLALGVALLTVSFVYTRLRGPGGDEAEPVTPEDAPGREVAQRQEGRAKRACAHASVLTGLDATGRTDRRRPR